MGVELDGLIQKIKEESVEEARKRSDETISEAKRKAESIIREAHKKEAAIIKNGEEEAKNLRKNGEKAIKQSARDVLLSLRQQIIELFNKVVKKEVSEELSADTLKQVLTKIIENFQRADDLDVEILLGKDDKKALEGAFLKSLTQELKKGVTLKVSPNIEKGFRIGEKNKNFYYDFTDEAISEAFALYLNPKIVEILNLTEKDAK
ncbi:MAG: hypothetical protein HQ575_05020 [Candidatus Omnitrophica bacterium]|nr:hypothetical protein [Candidatus Omnitrophota bacterium]